MGSLEEVANLVDEALRLRRHLVSGLVGELLEQFALSRVELRRNFHEYPHVEITTHLLQLCGIKSGLERRQTLATQTQHPSGLCPFWNLELDLSVERRHFDFRAEYGLDEGHRDLEMEIGAVSLEERMVAKNHHDVEIARFAPRDAGFALATDTQPRTIIDARRNLQLNRLLAFDPTGAPAFGAGIRNDLACTATGVTRSVHAEEPLLEGELPDPFAAPTACRLRALGRARPRTGLAASHLGDLDTRLAAVQNIVEINSQVVPEICAALPATAPTARTASGPAEDVTEKVIEEIAKIPEVPEIAARMSTTGPTTDTGMPKTIVTGALLRVREDSVGLGNLLEAFFSDRVVRIAVRMAFERELPIGLFEVGLACGPIDPQNLVKIPLTQTNPLFRSLRVTIGGQSSHVRQCQGGRVAQFSLDSPVASSSSPPRVA
jgi:hypothetical protein